MLQISKSDQKWTFAVIPGERFGTQGRWKEQQYRSRDQQQDSREMDQRGRGVGEGEQGAGGERGGDRGGSGPCQCALTRLSGTPEAAFALIILC